MHKGVNHWDYFVKTVQIDGTVFDLTANVRKKADGEFVYIIEMVENNEIEPSSPQDSQNSGRNRIPNSSKVSISNPEADVKEKNSLRDDDYMEAVDSGDMAAAQKMVDDYAVSQGFSVDADGDPDLLFHGTDSFGFTKIDTSKSDDSITFWATPNMGVAGSYYAGSNYKIREIGREKITPKGEKLPHYSSMEKAVNTAKGAATGSIDLSKVKYAKESTVMKKAQKSMGNAVKAAEAVLDGDFSADIQKIARNVLNAAQEGTYEAWAKAVNQARWQQYAETTGVRFWELDLGDNFNPDKSDISKVTKADPDVFRMMYHIGDVLDALGRDDTGTLGGETIDKSDIIEAHNEAVAEKGIYGFYHKQDNPFVYDCGGSAWNKIEVPNEAKGDLTNSVTTTRELAQWAFAKGYDAIRLDNVVDIGGYALKEARSPATVWAFKNPGSQLKSADPVTYDDKGNVIPLSERFNAENEDIRHSLRNAEAEKAAEAVQKENEKLKEDVQRLRDLLKLQRQVTGGTKFTASSVEAAARYLKQTGNIKGNTGEFGKLLNDFYEAIAQDRELSWENVREYAQPVVAWMMDHRTIEQGRTEYADEILKEMRTSRISLDENQKGEAAYRWGSFNDFRKASMGSVIVANDGVPLDTKWQEWASLYPDVFDAGITATDMPGALMDTIDRLRNSDLSRVEAAYQAEMIEQDMLRQVYDSYWRVSTLKTVADVKQRQINELKSKHYTQMDKLRSDHREKTEQLKREHREQVQHMRQKYRQNMEARQKEVSARYQESRKKATERRQKAEMRGKIRKTVRELTKLLEGGKNRNVKKGMQDFAANAIASAEILFADAASDEQIIRSGVQTDVTEVESALLNKTVDLMAQAEKIVGYDALTQREKIEQKIQRNILALQPVLTRERARMNKVSVDTVLDNLANAYKDLQNAEENYIRSTYDEFTYQYLDSIKEDVKGTLVRDMTLEQMETLYKAYTVVLTKIRTANKRFVEGKNATVQQTAEALRSELEQRKTPQTKVAAMARTLANRTGWSYEKLYYALERIGSKTMTELFGNLADSENTVMRDVMEAAQFRDKLVEKYHYNDWAMDRKIEKDFVDNTGKTFRLTLGEMMSLYAYSRREGAWNHIEYGGFTFGKTALTDTNPASTYKLSREQCEAVCNTLTKEQKAFAEEMQTFLSDVMGSKGNEVSMQLYGIEMFGEKNYFPIHIAGQFKAAAQESNAKAEAGFASMKNAGFTQAQNRRATAPFVMESFMEVWADHVNEMSRYHGTVLALEDIRRVMNYSAYSDATSDSVSIKATLENKFGKAATQYFDDLYREANSGAITDKMQKMSQKLLSKFRKNSVAYSLSVLIQQPASLCRAYAMIDKKYFGGFRGIGALPVGVAKTATDKWLKEQTKAYKEMLQYAPGVTMAKEIGGFDTVSGFNIRSYLLDTHKSLLNKMKTETAGGKARAVFNKVDDNAIANLPNVADKIAWIEIWNACKRETVAKHPKLETRSEAFMQAVGDRFTEVIRATQVYDSIFAKSPLMKSKNLAVQYLVSFMNEPNTVANMVENSIRHLVQGDAKTAARTVTAVIRSVIFTTVLKSVIYAMRDDDEEETYTEKYLASLVENLLSDITIFNYFPMARDVWSLSQGYDVERPDVAVIADAITALNKASEFWKADTSDMSEEELEAWDKKASEANWKLVESAATFFGIPMKNIRREINAVVDHANIASNNRWMTTSLSASDAISQAIADASPIMIKPDTKTKGEKLLYAVLEGDENYVRRLKTVYSSDEACQTAFKKAVKDKFLSGELAQKRAVEVLVSFTGCSADDAKADVAYWQYVQHYSGDVSSQWFDSYYDKVDESGIDIAVYVEYRTKRKGVTKKADILKIIHSLPLTKAQKDALYFAEGWAESTLGEAPWH